MICSVCILQAKPASPVPAQEEAGVNSVAWRTCYNAGHVKVSFFESICLKPCISESQLAASVLTQVAQFIAGQPNAPCPLSCTFICGMLFFLILLTASLLGQFARFVR